MYGYFTVWNVCSGHLTPDSRFNAQWSLNARLKQHFHDQKGHFVFNHALSVIPRCWKVGGQWPYDNTILGSKYTINYQSVVTIQYPLSFCEWGINYLFIYCAEPLGFCQLTNHRPTLTLYLRLRRTYRFTYININHVFNFIPLFAFCNVFRKCTFLLFEIFQIFV